MIIRNVRRPRRCCHCAGNHGSAVSYLYVEIMNVACIVMDCEHVQEYEERILREGACIPGIYPAIVNGKLIQKSLPNPNRAATAEQGSQVKADSLAKTAYQEVEKVSLR